MSFRFEQYLPQKQSKKYRIILPVLLLTLLAVPGIGSYRQLQSLAANDQTSSLLSLTQQLDKVSTYTRVKKAAPTPPVYSKAYVLMDGATAEILSSKQPHASIPVASTTKMTTALVAKELLPFNKVVTVSNKPPTAAGSRIGLKAGEQITVGNLVKGLLIQSGNDAAFALAEAYSGKPGEYQPFIDKMNSFLKENHLTHTQFADPAGLDDDNGRSTPAELAHIARLLLSDQQLAQIVTTPDETITNTGGTIVHELKNTNRLIQPESGYYLSRALGVKTGFTHGAGHSLVAAYKFHDRILIGVVMNTNEYTNEASAKEMRKLFVWADEYVTLEKY